MNYWYVVFSYQDQRGHIVRKTATGSGKGEFSLAQCRKDVVETVGDPYIASTFIIENWIPISATQYNDWNGPDSVPTTEGESKAV